MAVALMQITGGLLWFLCVNGATASSGEVRKLRGVKRTDSANFEAVHRFTPVILQSGAMQHLHVSSKFVQKIEKPKQLEEMEAFHEEWVALTSFKNLALANWLEIIVSATLWIVLVVIAACMYKSSSRYIPETGPNPFDPDRTRTDLAEWQSEWYQCHRYPEIFLWSCCCPCIRWAHTMDLVQFLDYWPAFFIFLILEVFNQLTAFVFVAIFSTILLVFYRQKMRKLFGISNYGTCTGYTSDCLGLFFCWPCLIAQEANHVEQAARKGWSKDLAAKTGLFSARYEASVSQEG